MSVKKKIPKKKLKQPDEFITLTERILLYLKTQIKRIFVLGGIILIIMISIYLLKIWEEKKEENAREKFNLAIEIYQKASYATHETSFKEYKDLLKKFDELISEFPRTTSGRLSILYKGNVHLRLGKFDEAINTFQEFLKKKEKQKLYNIFALEGLGYAYEGKSDYENAIKYFKKVIEIGEGFQVSNAYFHIGICEERLGRKMEAIDNYRNFLNTSQKSFLSNMVIKKISNLEK